MRIALPSIDLFKKSSLFFALLIIISHTGIAQTTFSTVANAVNTGANCYTLTTAALSQKGAVWYNNKIDLNYNFDISFSLNFGSNQGFSGGDGMAFVLQPVNTAQIGYAGSAKGYGNTYDVNGNIVIPGISPSIDIEYDTYDDFGGTTAYAALLLNGDYRRTPANTGVGQVPIGFVNNGQFHTSRVTWDATNKIMTLYFDGVQKFTYQKDIVTQIFSGQNFVYFGFTAATGGSVNQQSVCFDPASSFQVYGALPPPVPTITANGPTTFCQGGSVNLSSSAAKNSLQFNGSNYVEAANTSATSLTNALTVEAWVKTDDPNQVQYIVSKGTNDQQDGQYGVLIVGGKFQFHLWQSGGHQGANGVTPIVAGQWYHISGTWDGITTKIYVNGILEGQAPLAGPISANPGPLEIGRLGLLTLPYSLYGEIDEVRIWNTARTASEIQLNMNRNVTANPSLVAYYKLDEGTGTTTADASNGNTASLINSPSWTVSGAPINYAAYAWSTGANTPTITVNTTGSYNVTVTDANGNTGTSAPVNVSILSASANISASGPTSFCPGGAVVLTANTGTSYLWSNGATTQAITVTASGSYTVTVTNSNVCSAVSAPLVVTATDVIPPVIANCPGNILQNTDPGKCGAVVSFSLPPLPPAVDQQITDNYVGTAGSDQWQSFTAGKTGLLTQIDLFHNGCINISFTLTIYSGTGTGGTVLYTGPINIGYLCSAWFSAAIPAGSQPQVTAGQTYTFRLQGSGLYFLAGSGNNPGTYYSSDYGTPPWKLDFKSYVAVGTAVTSASDNCSIPILTSNHQSGELFPVGTTVVTYTATDAAGNSSSCSFNVIVTDTEKPHVKTKPAIVLLVNGSASLLPSDVDNGSTDNCNITSMTLSKMNFDCSNKGPNNVLFTVTDVNGNSASANVVVTVIDASSPVPNTAALPVLAGQCSVSATAPTATDGCGAIITATTNGPVTFSTQGSFTINWTYTAANGKTTSQSQQVIIHDITPPSIPSLPDITGQCSVAATAPTTTDNCAGTVIGTTTDLLNYNQQGNYVIHWSFADGNGNTTTATQNVIVKDITPPVINSLSDISAIATSASGAVVNYTAPVGTDNCSGASTILTAGLASGATFPIGITTVSYTVTDVAGLKASSTFTVTVSGLAPQIIVPSSISVNNDAGQCGAAVNYTAVETTGIPASIITYSVAPGTLFPVGTTTVTATAINAVGTSSKTFTVTVTDNEKPNFFVSGTASLTIPYLQSPISSSASVTYNFTDPLPAGSIVTSIDLSYSAADQGWGYTGGYTRFYVSGTFIGGNKIPDHFVHSLSLNYSGGIPGYVYGGSNTFQFGFEGYPGWQGFFYGGTMIIHYQKTTIPAPVSVKNDAGKCGAVVILTSPVTSDNCGVASVTNDAPALFSVGTTTITWKVTDLNGNSNTTTQMVTVTDNEPPKITVPANLTVNTDMDDKVASNVNLGTAVTVDNCAVASVQNDAPAILPLGVTSVTWTAKDIHGNTITAVQTVTVIDNQPPAIATMAAITKNNDSGVCGAIINYSLPGVTDNVSTNSIIVSAGDADGTVVFNTPLTSNVNSLNFISSGPYNDIAHGHGVNITVTIELYNPLTNAWTTVQSIQTGRGDYHFGGTAAYFPVISQVSQIRFTASQYVGYALHLYQMGINLNSIPFVQTAGLASGSLFPVGTTLNAFQAIDVAGNISSQSLTVTVIDAEKPQISDYQGSIQFAVANCSWTGSGGVFTVTDNCSSILVVSEKDYDSLGNMIYTGQYPVTQGMNTLANKTFPLGVNTVQLTVTDVAGNVSDRVVFNVKVVDNTNPSIVTSGNITQSSDPGTCSAYIRVPQPVTHDNCSIQSLINSFNNNVSATGNYPVGVTVVNWTVTDASGNKSTATQTITVTDNEPPVIIGVPLPVIQTNDAGTCGAVVTWTPVLATDNCRVLSFTSDHQSGETFPLGITTVTFTAKDIHNNISTSSFTITVTDNEAPKVITKPVTVTLINGSATITPSDINNGSSDNCGAVTLSLSKTNFTCANTGINPVTLTVTDSYGNSSSATATVTVVGEVPTSTILVTPSNTVYTGGVPTDIYLGYGPQSVSLTANVLGITPVTYSWTGGTGLNCVSCQNPVFTPVAAGSYTFTVTATNKYGCSTTSPVSICVRDIRVTATANSKVYVCHTDLTTGVAQTLTLAVNAVANQLTLNPQDVLGSCGMPPCTVSNGIGVSIISNPVSGTVINNATKEESTIAGEGILSVTVSPNPSATVFTLKIHTQKKIPVHVRLIDESGRVVEGRDNAPVETAFAMGAKLITGMYFAEILQGKERVVVKLIKQNR